MKNIKTGTYFYNDKSYNFEFATDLSAYKKMLFVRYVVNSIVNEDNYDSIVKDMIFDFGLVSVMTDIDTSFINKRDDKGDSINPIISIEQFLEETSVVDVIKANMKVGLLEELNDAVNKSIAYRTGIHPNPLNDALASLVSTLEKKVNEYDMGSMMEMAQKFVGMTGELTPESVVNAYINSDMHKQNLEEIVKSKAEKNEIKIGEGLGEAVRTIVEENKAEKDEKAELL